MARQFAHGEPGLRRYELHLTVACDCDQLRAVGIRKSIDRFSRRDLRIDSRNRQFSYANSLRSFRANIDPALNCSDFLRVEFFAFAGRHDNFFAVALDPILHELQEQTFGTFARNDYGSAFAALHQCVEAFQNELGLRFLGFVTI